jgi:hypothetical protein
VMGYELQKGCFERRSPYRAGDTGLYRDVIWTLALAEQGEPEYDVAVGWLRIIGNCAPSSLADDTELFWTGLMPRERRWFDSCFANFVYFFFFFSLRGRNGWASSRLVLFTVLYDAPTIIASCHLSIFSHGISQDGYTPFHSSEAHAHRPAQLLDRQQQQAVLVRLNKHNQFCGNICGVLVLQVKESIAWVQSATIAFVVHPCAMHLRSFPPKDCICIANPFADSQAAPIVQILQRLLPCELAPIRH